MKNSQIIILASFILMVIVSFTLLSWKEGTEHNLSHGKDWWTISFVEPTSSESFDFILENYSSGEEFTYTLQIGIQDKDTQTFTVPKDTIQTLSIDKPTDPKYTGKKLRLVVTDSRQRKQEMYKYIK